MGKIHFWGLIFFFLLACEQHNFENRGSFDVILVIGQSNTLSGSGYDPILDKPHPHIFQLGRHGRNNFKILTANDPLEHHSVRQNKIGFVMTFAKLYTKKILDPGRQILIIPCGKGSTGFIDNNWNKGDHLYEDAVFRTNFSLKYLKDSRLVTILWHQGERDVNNVNHLKALDSMIVNIRKDIDGNSKRIPFILGGMVPYWVDQSTKRKNHEKIIKNTPNRIEFTGFANPRIPFIIEKDDNTIDEVHYNAEGQRELGRRYFIEYQKLATNQ